MKRLYMNVTLNCSVLIDTMEGSIHDLLIAEYGDMLSEHRSGDIIGSVTHVGSLSLPTEATLLVDGRLYYSGSNVYLLSAGSILKLILERNTFQIVVDNRTAPTLVPLTLEALLNYYLPQLGFVFLHTAAFQYKGSVCAILAFGGVGKTETALEYLLKDAAYISDDIALFQSDGKIIPWTRRISLHDYPFTIEKLRRFGLSPLFWKLKEKLKGAKHFPFRSIYSRLRSRFNLRLHYTQLTKVQLQGRKPMTVDAVWWMEQGSETTTFTLTQEEFLFKMQVCMRHEFCSWVDFEGYLGLVYDFWPLLVQQHEEVLQHTIQTMPVVQGVKIAYKEYQKAAGLLFNS